MADSFEFSGSGTTAEAVRRFTLGVDGNDHAATVERARRARMNSSDDPIAWIVGNAEGDLDMLMADRMFLHGVRDTLGHMQAPNAAGEVIDPWAQDAPAREALDVVNAIRQQAGAAPWALNGLRELGGSPEWSSLAPAREQIAQTARALGLHADTSAFAVRELEPVVEQRVTLRRDDTSTAGSVTVYGNETWVDDEIVPHATAAATLGLSEDDLEDVIASVQHHAREATEATYGRAEANVQPGDARRALDDSERVQANVNDRRVDAQGGVEIAQSAASAETVATGAGDSDDLSEDDFVTRGTLPMAPGRWAYAHYEDTTSAELADWEATVAAREAQLFSLEPSEGFPGWEKEVSAKTAYESPEVFAAAVQLNALRSLMDEGVHSGISVVTTSDYGNEYATSLENLQWDRAFHVVAVDPTGRSLAPIVEPQDPYQRDNERVVDAGPNPPPEIVPTTERYADNSITGPRGRRVDMTSLQASLQQLNADKATRAHTSLDSIGVGHPSHGMNTRPDRPQPGGPTRQQ